MLVQKTGNRISRTLVIYKDPFNCIQLKGHPEYKPFDGRSSRRSLNHISNSPILFITKRSLHGYTFLSELYQPYKTKNSSTVLKKLVLLTENVYLLPLVN